MSNKIKRLYRHEIEAMREPGLYNYFTQHSWTLDEFRTAFLNDDGTQSRLFEETLPIFKQEWDIEQEGCDTRKRNREGEKKLASVEEIITQKYFVTGGSARWMFSLTREQTDFEIRASISDAKSVEDILDCHVGPESPLAKMRLYSSMLERDGPLPLVEYAIVSERATQILVEEYGVSET